MGSLTGTSNRKGQFYILMSVILVGVLFALAYPMIKVTKPRVDIKHVADNYVTEAAYAVDTALIEEEDPDERLQNFTGQFLDFARQKETNLEMVYLLFTPDVVIIRNYNAGKFTVYQENQDDRFNDIECGVMAPTDSKTIKRTGYVKLVKDDVEYRFEMPEEKYKVKALFIS
ncbi:hypothetical protein JW968_06030 [Candidatus Woesearchaeota archaeon]|nr:hypothetical protein [Candidatus Woesearchaeota archaeon]